MKKIFVLGGIFALSLCSQPASTQTAIQDPEIKPILPAIPPPVVTEKAVPKPTSVVYECDPSMWLIQSQNLLIFHSCIAGAKIEKISVRTGGPGLQSKRGKYYIPWFSRDPVYFSGWGSSTLFADFVWPFVPEGQTIASMVARGELVGAGHTQPRHCDGLQTYLGKQKKWATLTNQFLKTNDVLQKTDPSAFSKAYFEFTNKNPKPFSPCSKAPAQAWGQSHGCVRIDGVTAPFIITWMQFHVANGKPLTLFIDQRPPSLPDSYKP
jgi:hypothetical protein